MKREKQAVDRKYELKNILTGQDWQLSETRARIERNKADWEEKLISERKKEEQLSIKLQMEGLKMEQATAELVDYVKDIKQSEVQWQAGLGRNKVLRDRLSCIEQEILTASALLSNQVEAASDQEVCTLLPAHISYNFILFFSLQAGYHTQGGCRKARSAEGEALRGQNRSWGIKDLFSKVGDLSKTIWIVFHVSLVM